jgi:hypothetical protein
VINRHKVAKHFSLNIDDNKLGWERREEHIAREASLDGIYVVRTSEPREELSAPDAVRTYKSLGNVEKAFRTFKGVDLSVRPIYHRLENRVRSHVLLCMLAYYVEWHMRQALASLLYVDGDLQNNIAQRDPVAKAQTAPEVQRKKNDKKSLDGLPLRRWDGLLASLSTIVLNTCRIGEGSAAVRFTRETEPNAFQTRIFELLKAPNPCWQQNCAQSVELENSR